MHGLSTLEAHVRTNSSEKSASGVRQLYRPWFFHRMLGPARLGVTYFPYALVGNENQYLTTPYGPRTCFRRQRRS